MRFDVISLFPEMFDAMRSGVAGRAIERGQVELALYPDASPGHNQPIAAGIGDERIDANLYLSGTGPVRLIDFGP